MYKFLFIFIVGFFSAQQKCNLSFSSNQILKEGKIILKMGNTGNSKIQAPKLFNAEFARPTDIQVYDIEKNDYVDTRYSFDGALCGNVKQCYGKMVCLKKAETKEYEVKIIPGRVSKAFKEKKKYRFKLAFDTYLFSGCNDYVTDWLYYDNTK